MQTATNPDTGETAVLVDGAWKKADKVATNQQGEKAYLLGGNWVSDPKPAVEQIPNNVIAPTPAPNKPLPGEQALGTLEALASGASGIVGGIAGQVAGVGKTLLGGKFGTQAGVQQGQDTARSVADAMTYRPRTETGQGIMEGIGNALDASKLAGLPPASAITGAGRLQAQLPIPRPSLPEKQPAALVGVGAASVDESRLRAERAAALPVPIPLTKGQATRTFDQQQFERETAKNPKAGAPLRERFADQNAKILQNFDAWVDETGAASGGNLRATGQIVTEAIANKAQMAKQHIKVAYDKARASGETAAPVDIKPLRDYIESHKPEAINAPVLSSVEAKIAQIAKGSDDMSINDLEEVRKMVGALSGKDATNAHFGKEVKTLIDSITENVGGTEYKRARLLRSRYAKEFEDVGVIDKMMSTKPGTSDRAVAYEDVFKHSVLGGSLDDVRAVRKTLQTAGKDGMQAWRELQGQTIQHIKDEITKNVATDDRGNKVVSAARLDRLVTELDKDGKLDFIFGKKGGEQIREVSAIAKDVFTSPPGSVNTSNTASILFGLLDTAISGATGVPLPLSSATNFMLKRSKAKALDKRVAESLRNP